MKYIPTGNKKSDRPKKLSLKGDGLFNGMVAKWLPAVPFFFDKKFMF